MQKDKLAHEAKIFVIEAIAETARATIILILVASIGSHESKHSTTEEHTVAAQYLVNRAHEYHEEQLTLVRGELLALD